MPRATTDELGHFVLELPKLEWINGILAFDASGHRGGIGALYGENEKSEIVIHLRPLVHLHGKMRLAQSGAAPEWSILCAYLPQDERKPLPYSRVAICGSWDGNVSLMLPPGDYELDANTDMQDYLDPETLRIKLTDDKLDYDLGELRLYPSKVKAAKQRGAVGRLLQVVWKNATSLARCGGAWHIGRNKAKRFEGQMDAHILLHVQLPELLGPRTSRGRPGSTN